ncbi:hypothetical protein GZL_09139 [Streptomyces sp. 769]|nr:hypothetical protein GZL_09139 [Streptomyces sp. 769]
MALQKLRRALLDDSSLVLQPCIDDCYTTYTQDGPPGRHRVLRQSGYAST